MTDKLTSLITVSVSLAAVFTLGSGEALAACTPDVFPHTDTPYITVCDADEDILIDVEDVEITATVSGTKGYGIFGSSESGDVTVNVRGGSVKTSGRRSPGIRGESLTGNVTVNVEGVTITTDSMTDTRQNRPSHGISAVINTPSADSLDSKVSVTAKDVTILTSGGGESHGIYGFSSKRTDNPDADTDTDIDIDIEDSSITTEGSLAHGIFGEHIGDGDVNIDVRGSNITSGDWHGIYGWRYLIDVHADTTGNIKIDARDSSITTKAYLGHGIYAEHETNGNIVITAQNLTVVTESDYLDDGSTQAHGIFALRTKAGNIEIDLGEEGSIETRGTHSYGIYGNLSGAQNEGTLSIRTGSGHTVTTTGAYGHGIVGYHYGTLDTSTIPSTSGAASRPPERVHRVFV